MSSSDGTFHVFDVLHWRQMLYVLDVLIRNGRGLWPRARRRDRQAEMNLLSISSVKRSSPLPGLRGRYRPPTCKIPRLQIPGLRKSTTAKQKKGRHWKKTKGGTAVPCDPTPARGAGVTAATCWHMKHRGNIIPPSNHLIITIIIVITATRNRLAHTVSCLRCLVFTKR